jgi:AcrR family transcriptional regulator
MSNESRERTGKRPYQQRARARQREEVHRRITLAAVELHGSVGPAQTTVSDIAEHAGVRRATVYNHFPTDLELLESCSSHWFSENPPPNPGDWAAIADPVQRVRVAFLAMYEYYDRGKTMLGNVLRDTPQVPALQEILRQKWWPLQETMVGILAHGWSHPESDPPAKSRPSRQEPNLSHDVDPEIRASLRVALDFFTWKTLNASGLSNQEAARLAAAWIEASDKLAH